MTQFLANLKNELFKLRKRKKYLIFLILGCLVCVASALRLVVANYISHGAISAPAALGGLTASNLSFILVLFLPLVAILAVCDLFVGEQADRTIRFALVRPVGKGKLFLSKAAAAFFLCAFDLAVLTLVSAITQVALGGGTRGIGASVLACLLDLIPLLALILFFCLVNQVVKGPGLVVLLSILLYVVLAAVGTYLPTLGGLLFTGYLRWHNLWLGVPLPFMAMLARVGLLVGYSLIFACGGYLLFDRKEA